MAGKLVFELFALVSLFTSASVAQSDVSQSLQAALRQEGFTQFAQFLAGPGEQNDLSLPEPNTRLIVYAPTDAGFLRFQSENGNTLTRRDVLGAALVDMSIAYSSEGSPTKRKRGASHGSGASCANGALDFMTLLSDKEFVNLPPGNNASLVQKTMQKGALPVVHSGLGDVVKVVALDIPFKYGVIRPVQTFVTLPRLLSVTLPFLAADKTLQALQRANLTKDFDNRTGITFLAPDDKAIPSDISPDVLAEVLKRHLIVGPPIFTSDLKDGDRFTTLGGTTVTVTTYCGDVFLNGAKILASDAIIKNGVVHTVDKLLDLPIFVTKTQVKTVTEFKTHVNTVHSVKTAEITKTTTEVKDRVKTETQVKVHKETETEYKVVPTTKVHKETETEYKVVPTTKVYVSKETETKYKVVPTTKVYVSKETETETYTKKEVKTETYKHQPPPPPPPPAYTKPHDYPKTTLATSPKKDYPTPDGPHKTGHGGY